MIDFTEIPDSDSWEAFCRDYLVALGLTVEVPPTRGPDGGLDLLMREQLRGSLTSRQFTWLVSCKHHATSEQAVGTNHELNITDRVAQHKANGFMGFYSTVASTALVQRLRELRDDGKIDEYEIYDGNRIQNGFNNVGLSGVLLQHLPASHTSLRPIHPLLGKYEPLCCEICDKDLLKESVKGKALGMIIFANEQRDEATVVKSIHFVCKGHCDQKMEASLARRDLATSWDDISGYCNPLIFIRRLTGYVNQMREAPSSYSKAAHDRMIEFYIALSQRTLRQTNGEDREGLKRAMELEEIGL